jgi:tRNA pseudouridine55 synthase
MNKVLNVYKPISYTPLQVIDKLKGKFPEYKDEKISYAGRLDPLAHGVLILLVGDENQKRREHEKMDKVYEFKCIIGIGTDTYDVLGLPKLDENIFEREIHEKEILHELMKFQGVITQELPPFSSYQIRRIPLFKWARMGRLNEIDIPRREIEVMEIKMLGVDSIPVRTMLKGVSERVSTLKGDFRQSEILKRWELMLKGHEDKELTILSAQAHVSAGTYIRSICHELGKNLGTSAVALEIYRTRSGEFYIDDSMRL